MKTYRLTYTFDNGLPEDRSLTIEADGYTTTGTDHLFHRAGLPVCRIASNLVKSITEVVAPVPAESL